MMARDARPDCRASWMKLGEAISPPHVDGRRMAALLDVPSSETIRLLGNATNRALLAELSREPSYPRALAVRMGLNEDDVQRKLRRLESVGLVRSAWAHVGRTVKQYRMNAHALVVELGTGAVRLQND
jgi:hypothetical protein